MIRREGPILKIGGDGWSAQASGLVKNCPERYGDILFEAAEKSCKLPGRWGVGGQTNSSKS